jgi:hypothetical protein
MAERKHHIVPKTYLRRFADGNEKLALRHRDGDAYATPAQTSISKACREGGFYNVGADNDDEDGESLENYFADLEGVCRPLLDRLAAGDLSLSDRQRMHVAFYVAMQWSRGWDARILAAQVVQGFARSSAFSTAMNMILDREEVAHRQLDEATMRHMALSWADGVRAHPGRAVEVAYPLHLGTQVAEYMFTRTWRILRFDRPCLLIGDSPVAVSPMPDGRNAGVAIAPAIWFPLARDRALAMTLRGDEKVVDSGMRRAADINQIIVNQSEKAIFAHPDDREWFSVHQPTWRRQFIDGTVGGPQTSSSGDLLQQFRIEQVLQPIATQGR